jgi:hypothetical protein
MFGKKLSGIFPWGIFSIRLCHSQFLQNKFNIQGTVNREEGQISMPVYVYVNKYTGNGNKNNKNKYGSQIVSAP